MTAAPAVAESRAAQTTAAPKRRRRARLPILNLAGAVVVSAAVLYVAFFPAPGLPALGPAFNPTTGAWSMAADAQVTDRMLHLQGLQRPVRVVLEKDGTAHITAQTDHDLFLATGYVHARFRLFQMDLLRRQGAGRLSEVVGKVALDVDRFELQLGLLRTAQLEWSQLPESDPSRGALLAYAQGVNDRIKEAKDAHQLDGMFKLLGYEPQPWTPIDSLLVKGDMTQTLNFTDTPLAMSLLYKSLGADLAQEWFPILPPNQQSPYDPGPYPKPTAPQPIASMEAPTSAAALPDVKPLYDKLAALPLGLVSRSGGASNNWAVAGAKSTSGGALLAGDPHLHLTLPAIWFQLTMDSPTVHVAGVSIPGTPVVLIGHNEHIAWSLTDAQNQQTFYYVEKEDPSHPDAYFWNGSWKPYTTVSYDIPVLGGPTQHVKVRWSVHGPVITDKGQTTAVWWAGNIPSQDLGVLLAVDRASNWTEFRDALRGWYSPTHNFVYADDQGHIGLISAGYYPQVAKGQPWLPMPGTGESDVVGTIPFDEIPQVFDPPDNVIWSANQRQVTRDYPYYIGTTSNFFDAGYRANEIHLVLSQKNKLSATNMQALQTDTRDYLAAQVVPVLLRSLARGKTDAKEAPAIALLKAWDYRMETDSAAATIWSYFWSYYMAETFDPWWKSRGVTVPRADEIEDALVQDLEAWTLRDPDNRTFSAPGVGSRTAPEAQLTAFHKAMTALFKLGPGAGSWKWGRVHTRTIENLADVSGLNYGPRADRGDSNTPLAAGGFPSTHGPSWRMVVDWGTHTFQGVYPGGQSENPASAWYTNRVDTWWTGDLSPMLSAQQAATGSGIRTWDLQP